MAKDEIIIKAELQIARAKTNIKKLNKEIEGLDMRLTESKLKVKQLANEELKLAKGKQLLTQRNKELTLSQKGLSNSTGAATSAALELGRVISDAPYGIRGVANNVSQLASQFSFMATAVDKTTGKVVGFNGALKNFGKAIKANAVLLLIQAVISAFDYFAGSVSKAEKQINSFFDTISSGFVKVSELEQLNEIINDSNTEIGEQEQALKRLAELGYKPANKEVEEFIENQKKLVIVNASIKAIEKELKAIYEERLKLQSKFKDEYKKLLEVQEEGVGGLDISKAVLEQIKLDKKDLDRKEEELTDEFNKLIRRSLKLTSEEVSFKIDKGSSSKKDIGLFDEEGVDLIKRQEAINQQLELLNTKSEEDKLNIRLKYQLIALRREKANETKAIESNLAEYKQKVEDRYGKDSVKYTELVTEAEKSASEAVIKTSEQYDSLIGLYEKLYNKRIKALGVDSNGDEQKKELSMLSHYIDSYKTLMRGIGDFLQGEADRQIAIEANKTNAMNAELNNRLLNENLSKGERARIQNEIAQNDEELRKKQNAIKKKAFNTQKAFNISMATIDTYAGAAKALATLPPPASFAVAGATIASGLLQVATIARQKFQPDAASTPIRTSGSGGAGGVGNRSFDFNLIGNNQNNQLADAIGSTFDKPVKAYVVSKDITNQQQLDANTKSAARFGD